MSKQGCDESAELTVTWADKMLDVCRYHAAGFATLANAIGGSSDARRYLGAPKMCVQKDKWSSEDKAKMDKNLKRLTHD